MERATNSDAQLAALFEPEDYLHFYAPLLTDERSDYEANFIASELGAKHGAKILDIACGFGRHSNRLAKMGFEVTGIDACDTFLQMAKDNVDKIGVAPRYLKRDMRKMGFQSEFDAATLLFTSFGYFSDAENTQVLSGAAEALAKGGLFALDIPNREGFVKHIPPAFVTERGEDLLIDQNEFDCQSGRMYSLRIIIRDGKRKETPFFLRIYSFTEIKAELERVGFNVMKVYGSWEGEPLTAESFKMIIFCNKI